MFRHTPAILAVSLALWPLQAQASEKTFSGDYSLYFLGIPVAQATFDSSYEGNVYQVDGKVSSVGLATFFDDTHGTISSRGNFACDGTRPVTFRANYVSGKKVSLVYIKFSGNRVTRTDVVPPPKKRGHTWIPLGTNDLLAVSDPIAATIIKAPSIDKVCSRTVRMYDGEMRANLRLTEVSRQTMSVKGFTGNTVICRIGFQPVSGYRTDKKALTVLRDRSRIMATFAQLGATEIYVPIYATVSTEIGTITVKARRFEAVN